MGNYNVQVSFRIKHPAENLDLAAKKLGLSPFRIWKAGNQRKTPKGTLLEGTYDSSYCCLTLENNIAESEELHVSDLIASFLEKLENHREYWSDLTLSGGTLCLVVFSDRDKYADEFDWQLLDRLSKLKISLGFEIY